MQEYADCGNGFAVNDFSIMRALRWSVGNDDNENFKLVGYNEWVNLSLIVLVQIHTIATAVSVK